MKRRASGWLGLGLLALGTYSLLLSPWAVAADDDAFTVAVPKVLLAGVDFDAKITGYPGEPPLRLRYRVSGADDDVPVHEGHGHVATRGEDGAALSELVVEDLRVERLGTRTLRFALGDQVVEREVMVMPAWLSILPPLLAIGLALILRQVVIALVAGVWLGAFFVSGYDLLGSLLATADTYAVQSLGDTDHASIIVFSLLLGGMIGVVTRSGGGLGLASLATRYAKDGRSGMMATWGMGLLIFFDDYANSLLVGSSMRPITDRLRVSREKLAFLVDATAAPVASIAIVSSWVGVEVGYIADQYAALGLEGDAFMLFLESVLYRFYPLLMLFFVVMLAWSRRDFGPMYEAELRARTEGKLLADGAEPASDFSDDAMLSGTPRAMNAVVPVVLVVLVALGGMYTTGLAGTDAVDASLSDIFGNANSYAALLWASFLGGIAALAMATASKALSLRGAMDAWLDGVKSMALACIILVLAWALGAVCKELQTAQFVIQGIGPWLDPVFLPAVVFVVAAAVSFATGTSWGTMAILFPLVVPMAHELAPGVHHIMLGAIGSILAGSVWGDHCSPISDTTIMSSMASSCDHVDHVRTQLPYAMTVGIVSLVIGELGTAAGLYPAWVGLVLGAVVLVLIVLSFGKPVPEYQPEPEGG